jgi:hypothetical protein
MIQRIQTVYLGLAFIMLMLMFFFPLMKYEPTLGDNHYGVFVANLTGADYYQNDGTAVAHKGHWYQYGIIGLMAVTLMTIFLFKNRALQLKVSWINFLLHIIGIGVMIYMANFVGPEEVASIFPNPKMEIEATYGYGFFLPLLSVTFLWLANRRIKKDEDLVKSLDRLR